MFNIRGHIFKYLSKFINRKVVGNQETVCVNCKTKEGLKRCMRCKSAVYCSRECQIVDWKNGHKINCTSSVKNGEIFTKSHNSESDAKISKGDTQKEILSLYIFNNFYKMLKNLVC